MPETILILDEPRTQLIERPLDWSRKAADFPKTAGRNLVFRWPGTHTYTLQPLNFTPAFTENDASDVLKLRLSDFNTDPALWKETAQKHNGTKSWDYFLNFVLTAAQVPANYPYHDPGNLLTNVPSVAGVGANAAIPAKNYANNSVIKVLTTRNSFDYNQGFCLRFYFEGRAFDRVGSVLRFQFAEYVLNLDTTGQAELFQTADFVSYAHVYSFRWCDQAEVHSRHHRLIVFPHCRNKIEFIYGNEFDGYGNWAERALGNNNPVGTVSFAGAGVYTVPGELVFDTNSRRYIITASAPCAVYICPSYRPYIQISRIGFANGSSLNNTPGNAFVFDSPTGLPFPCQSDFTGYADYDANGCSAEFGLYDPVSKANYAAGKGFRQLQFAATLHGNGTAATNNISTATPELYGYSITKGPLFQTSKDTPRLVRPQSQRIVLGQTPEEDRLTVTIPNDQGALDAWNETGCIQVALGDVPSNRYLFEGSTVKVESIENVQSGYALVMECKGMADDLKRAHWNRLAPDFGVDPKDSSGRGWFWSEAIFRCFEIGGVPRQNVVIEELDLYDFRLPNAAGGGGTGEYRGKDGGSSTGHSDGHVDNAAAGGYWKPKENSTPYDFIDYVLRGYLGWHWNWNVLDGKYHLWKRPIPGNARDNAKLANPLAVFIGDTSYARVYQAAHPNIPVYVHRGRKTSLHRPQHAGVLVSADISESRLRSKEQLAARLAQESTQGGTSDQSEYVTSVHRVECALLNPNAYPNIGNNYRRVNTADWLGKMSIRDISVVAPTRETLAFIARRAYYHHCFGQEFTTLNADWGDDISLGFRKWAPVLIDSGKDANGHPNGTLEEWLIDSVEPSWTRDSERFADYRLSKRRFDCPPPF
jgi:hypothetical protein